MIFISHDSRDAALAEAFENLLTDASGGVLKSFRSSDRRGTSGIEFGAEWYAAIMAKLDEATDVVALLTPHSLDRPWILYEVGVARGKLNRTAFGLAIGITLDQVAGPFAQFQNSGDDEDSLTKLVLQLIRRNPDASPREEAVRRQVTVFRESTRSALSAPVKRRDDASLDPATIAKLFEEVKIMFRELPGQIVTKIEQGRRTDRSAYSWSSRGHELVRKLRDAPDVYRRDVWADFVALLAERSPDSADAALDVLSALNTGDERQLHEAEKALRLFLRRGGESEDAPDTGSAAHMLEHAVSVLRQWRRNPQLQLQVPTTPKKVKKSQPA